MCGVRAWIFGNFYFFLLLEGHALHTFAQSIRTFLKKTLVNYNIYNFQKNGWPWSRGNIRRNKTMSEKSMSEGLLNGQHSITKSILVFPQRLTCSSLFCKLHVTYAYRDCKGDPARLPSKTLSIYRVLRMLLVQECFERNCY